MNSNTNIHSRISIAYRALVLALVALLASATSLIAQELRIAVPSGEFGYEAGLQVEGEAATADVEKPPIFVEPPEVISHAAYWEEAMIHPMLRPPVILTAPTARIAMWWDSIETVLGLGDRDGFAR